MKEMSKKILVVDNHPVMLKFMTQLLSKAGCQVLTAENGLMAMDILTAETPDVIFTDLIMPNIDGENLCRMVRAIPRLKDVYLVVISAIAAEEETHFAAFGADACIAKGPFDKMERHVLSVLDGYEKKSPPPSCVGLEDVYPRQITKELLSVKKHYEVVLKGMAEGILELTQKGRVLYANPRALSLVGLPESELLASHFTHLLQEPDRQRVEERLNAAPETARDMGAVIRGREMFLRFRPVLAEGRKTVILILDDVSERKRMEAQLLEAQKMEAIGTLAGGIAHDFNNLLMVIQGNVSLMLLDLNASHPYYEMLKSIEKKVQAGSKLTSQLLGYARKGMYEIRPIHLNPLVEATSEAFGRTRREITVHRNLAPNLRPVEADRGQIEQVLINLLVNAAEAMPGGGDLFLETVNISPEEIRGKICDPKSGDYIRLTVRDTGRGMDPKTLTRVFEPFFTTKGLGGGIGLGLASAYGIVKSHGGTIDVESEEGKGTVFKVYLPASEKKVSKTVKMADEAPGGAGVILLVDDEDLVLGVGQKFLKVLGYRVLTARDGKEAIDLYGVYRDIIDVVILDLVMPTTGGGEVFDRLREINPAVKVLLSSGYSLSSELAAITGEGIKGVIQKPFNIKELSNAVAGAIAGTNANATQ